MLNTTIESEPHRAKAEGTNDELAVRMFVKYLVCHNHFAFSNNHERQVEHNARECQALIDAHSCNFILV